MVYTLEESAIVLRAVTLSGMAVAMADVGVVSTAIEATALAQEVAGAARKYPNNSIIQAVFANETLKKLPLEEIPKDATPENAIEMATTAIREAISLLQPKATPAELAEYQQFIYAAAEQVAEAAGDGLFGTGETKVSDREMATLAKLKAVLA
ncbi:hypothetical protein IFO70_09585 [Phormidium tenue FACHB-886]|nr:hypothetical protein [Phormidium tenue FACHB-886]